MDVSSFPLLHLPNNARMHVLRNMHRFESINLSFCSKATKALVKSLNLRALDVSVLLSDEYLAIEMLCENFSIIQTDFTCTSYRKSYDIKKFIPDSINSRYQGIDSIYRIEFNKENDGYRIINCIKHYLEVLHHSAIYFNLRSSNFEIKSISAALKEFNLKKIEIEKQQADVSYTQRFLKEFPHPKELCIHRNPFEDIESTRRFLMQNFDYLCLEEHFPVELDDLLMINSSVVDIFDSKLLVKDLNVFIKHWIDGSNKRLQYLYVWPNSELRKRVTDLNENNIFNGVEYQTAPVEQIRTFNISTDNWEGKTVVNIKGGYDIQRKDGTTATITYKKKFPIIKMFVWP